MRFLERVLRQNLFLYQGCNTRLPMRMVLKQLVKFLEMRHAHVGLVRNLSVVTALLKAVREQYITNAHQHLQIERLVPVSDRRIER